MGLLVRGERGTRFPPRFHHGQEGRGGSAGQAPVLLAVECGEAGVCVPHDAVRLALGVTAWFCLQLPAQTPPKGPVHLLWAAGLCCAARVGFQG